MVSSSTVDTESLGQAANALGAYIGEIQEIRQKMIAAATDCSDNMSSDVYSLKAISKLLRCIKNLDATIQEAQTLQQTILKKKQQIEESAGDDDDSPPVKKLVLRR